MRASVCGFIHACVFIRVCVHSCLCNIFLKHASIYLSFFVCASVCVHASLRSELMSDGLNEWQCTSLTWVSLWWVWRQEMARKQSSLKLIRWEEDEDVLLSSTPLPSSVSSCINSVPAWQPKLKTHTEENNLFEHLKRNFSIRLGQRSADGSPRFRQRVRRKKMFSAGAEHWPLVKHTGFYTHTCTRRCGACRVSHVRRACLWTLWETAARNPCDLHAAATSDSLSAGSWSSAASFVKPSSNVTKTASLISSSALNKQKAGNARLVPHKRSSEADFNS